MSEVDLEPLMEGVGIPGDVDDRENVERGDDETQYHPETMIEYTSTNKKVFMNPFTSPNIGEYRSGDYGGGSNEGSWWRSMYRRRRA